MNFNKTPYLTLELDKNKSEIKLENRINELFEFIELKSNMIYEYYHHVVNHYLISLRLNPNEYWGYNLYYNSKFNIVIYLNHRSHKNHDKKLEIKVQSDMWKETHQFFNNKKYEDLIKSISKNDSFTKSYSFSINNYCHNHSCTFFYEKNYPFVKNYLIDKELKDFFHKYFKYFIDLQNQSDLALFLEEQFIEVYYKNKNHFIFDFTYQIAKNKKELIDMLLNFKMQIEYEINNI